MGAYEDEMTRKRSKHDALSYDTVIDGFHFDHTNKKWCAWECLPSGRNLVPGPDVPEIYDFDDIKAVRIIKGSVPVVEHKKGVLSRAVIGGIVAGGVGAVVGAMTAPTVSTPSVESPHITLDDTLIIDIEHRGFSHTLSVQFYYCSGDGPFYVHLDSAQPLLQEFEKILTPPASPATSYAEELKTLKSLLDDNIITQEDFEAKKKQLLNL